MMKFTAATLALMTLSSTAAFSMNSPTSVVSRQQQSSTATFSQRSLPTAASKYTQLFASDSTESETETTTSAEVETTTEAVTTTETPDDTTTMEASTTDTPTPDAADAAPVAKKVKKAAPKHKDGVFSPVVIFTKEVLGDERLNKIRGKAISIHSDVIGSFVGTAESAFGDAVVRALFKVADKNKDGTISKEELEIAVTSLGFTWLQEKQVGGIFKRADSDGDGTIDMDEWVKEAPKTLRTNLIKLAKKNGGDMGLLS